MKAISRTYSLLLLFPFAFDKASCPPPTATVRQKGGKHTLAHCGTVGRRSVKVYHLLLLLLLSILFSLCLQPGKCSLYTNDFRIRNSLTKLVMNLFFLVICKSLVLFPYYYNCSSSRWLRERRGGSISGKLARARRA